MCTLAVAFHPGSALPLCVAANRDEALDRPATGPALRAGPPPFIAPRDERAGGTWLGLAASGLFVGITNRFGKPPERTRASRGALVWSALAQPSAQALRDSLSGLPGSRYNPFHLVYADAERGFITWSDGDSVQHVELAPGLAVITERSLGAVPQVEREARLRQAWADARVRAPDDLERLIPALTLHDPRAPLRGTCVHADALNYGTRSSLLLALPSDRRRARMLWAEGRPCTHAHADRAALLRALWP